MSVSETLRDRAVPALLALLVAGSVLVGSAGVAAAAVVTDPANFGTAGSDEVENTTFSVTEDTQSVYVEMDSANASGNANVTVSWEQDDGTTGEVETVQLQPNSDGSAVLHETTVDPANYSTYRVVVTANSSDVPASAIDTGTVELVAGSGGGGGSLEVEGDGLTATIMGVPVVLALAAVGAFLIARD